MHVMTLRRTHVRYVALVAAALLALSVVYATDAGAEPDHKTYTIDFSADAVGVAPGGTVGFTATFTNTADPQSFDGVDIALPAGFAFGEFVGDSTGWAWDGQLIKGRSLGVAADASTTITFTATALDTSCDAGAYTWTADLFAVKQANEFDGDGNDFTLTEATGLPLDFSVLCGIEFVNQPASQQVEWSITDVAFDEFGAGYPIDVRAFDQTGATASWYDGAVTLSFVGEENFSAGVVSFGDFSILEDGTGYRLTATSAGFTATSNSFNIYEQVVKCSGAEQCSANGQGTTTNATITGDANADTILVSVDDTELTCGGVTFPSETVLFDVTGEGAFKTIEVTYTGADKPASKYDLCAGLAVSFVDKNGNDSVAVDFGDGIGTLFVGLLPTCKPKPKPSDMPCVQTRSQDKQLGTVTLFALLPPGDPLVRIG